MWMSKKRGLDERGLVALFSLKEKEYTEKNSKRNGRKKKKKIDHIRKTLCGC